MKSLYFKCREIATKNTQAHNKLREMPTKSNENTRNKTYVQTKSHKIARNHIKLHEVSTKSHQSAQNHIKSHNVYRQIIKYPSKYPKITAKLHNHISIRNYHLNERKHTRNPHIPLKLTKSQNNHIKSYKIEQNHSKSQQNYKKSVYPRSHWNQTKPHEITTKHEIIINHKKNARNTTKSKQNDRKTNKTTRNPHKIQKHTQSHAKSLQITQNHATKGTPIKAYKITRNRVKSQ